MNITTITVRYSAKRSAGYQSAEVSAEMSIQCDEGEGAAYLYSKALAMLAPMVDESVARQLMGLIEDDRAMKGI